MLCNICECCSCILHIVCFCYETRKHCCRYSDPGTLFEQHNPLLNKAYIIIQLSNITVPQ